MILLNPRIWWISYPALCAAFLGAHVAAVQLFLVIRNLSVGEPSNPEKLILGSGALGMFVGQALLLFTPERER